MRLPVEPLPPPEPADDLYAIRRRVPVPRAGQVTARSLPPLVISPHHEPIGEAEPRAENAAKDTGDQGEGREIEDRRLMCRRIYHLPVLLDTRSGEDRRRHARRDDDPVTGVDKEV